MSTQGRELLQRACAFLARREHSRQELHYKLARTCKDNNLLEELLDRLAAKGLQSDARFTESFVHHRLNKGQGPVKIEQELVRRGIEQGLISGCLESAMIDWLAKAEEARVKKFGGPPPSDGQNQAKQSRFLYSRGFSSEQISRLFK